MDRKLAKNGANKDNKLCIKLLMSGEIHLINIKEFKKEFSSNPSLGDRLQYELHNYCRINCDNLKEASLVAELAVLCYSETSVAKFSNIDRFLGCVYYITAYLLKSEKYSGALHVINSLNWKKEEIVAATKIKVDLRNIFCSLHSIIISGAISLASKVKSTKDKCYALSHELVMTSLKIFLFSQTHVSGIEKKVFKTTKLYLLTLNHYKNEDVADFYKLLQKVFTHLLPNFCQLDYFTFHLLRLDQDIKGTEHSQVCSQLKRIINIISVMLDFPSTVTSTFSDVLNLFFHSDQIVNDKSFSDLFMSSSSSNVYFIIIITIFNSAMQLWWNEFESENLSQNSLESVCKLLKKFMEFQEVFQSHVTLHYSSSDSSNEICFSEGVVGCLHKIQYTVRLLIKHKFLPQNCSLISIAREAFTLALNCMKVMESKGCSHRQRSALWKPTIIHHINLVEDILKYSSSENWWLELRDCSHEALQEIFSSEFEVPFDSKRIIILFKRLHLANLKLKAFNDCFYVCMAYYVAFPHKESDVMYLWIQTKAESSNDIIQETTVAEHFRNWSQSLKGFNKTGKNIESILKCLLLMELKAYALCSWKTFQEPKTGFKVTKKVWAQLLKFEPDLWERSFGLCALISTSTFANEAFPSDFQRECHDFIEYLISWKHNDKTQCRSLLHAANLKFFLFLHKLKGSEANEDQINSSHMVLDYLKKVEEEKLKLGENVDLNLSCDVISSSANLTVELETQYCEGLDEVVELWAKAINAGCDAVPTLVEFEMWQQTMKHAAYFYALIGEYQRSLFVWLLYYKLGKLRNDSVVILLGLSYLIKSLASVNDSPLVKEALEVSDKLQVEGREKCILVELWLALASNHLKNKEENSCLQCLFKAKDMIGKLGFGVSSSALSARFWCLVSKFLFIYPEREEMFGYPTNTDLRLPVFRAFSCANAGARSNLIQSVAQGECMELIIAMLEVNLWAFHFYEIYRKTDYMRLFLDDLYQIVQKLNLPTRTAELVLRLAEVDMIREKITECRGKVIKVKSILTTLSSKCGDFEKGVVDSPPLFDLNESEMEAATLRPVSPARFLQPSAASSADLSPVQFHLAKVNLSKTSHHVKSCDCRLCKNILIRILTMNALVLEGQIQEAEENEKDAVVSFAQASETVSSLNRLACEQTKTVGRRLEEVFRETPTNVDFTTKPVQFFSARFLIKYGFFEIACQKKVTKNLLKIIEKISRVMDQISYKEKLLVWTFTELKTVCCFLNEDSKRKLWKKESPVVYKAVGNNVTPLPRTLKKPTVKTACKGTTESFSSKSPTEEVIQKNAFQPVIEEDELDAGKKLRIRPAKLLFDSSETSTAPKTVLKVPSKKISVIQPKKLDFDKTDEEKESVSSKTRSRVLTTSTGRRKCESLVDLRKSKCSSIGKRETKEKTKPKSDDKKRKEVSRNMQR